MFQGDSNPVSLSSFSDFSSEMQSAVDLREDVSDAEAQRMLCHINQLQEIR